MMDDEQFNSILKHFDDAQWFNGIYLAGLSKHCNWEIVCKFSGFERNSVTRDYTFDINVWRQTFKDEGIDDWSLDWFGWITR